MPNRQKTIKNSRVLVILFTYLIVLGAFALAGTLIYNDYSLQHVFRKSPQLTAQDAVKLVYVNLPVVYMTLPPSHEARAGNIRIQMTLQVQNQYAAKISNLAPRINDRIVEYAETLHYDDLTAPHAPKWLKPDLQQIITDAARPTPIRDVIFKEFSVF